jgi:hypothetical protein
MVNEWMGKEILFPETVSCYVGGKETLPEICNECFQKDFKILIYLDSTGCSSCRLNLFEWKQLVEEADSLFHGKVGFLLFFQQKNEKEMSYLFAFNRFDYPVFMDIKGTINCLNRFPKAMEYQCFLLDSDNKVLMIGNPVLNPKIWELYKTKIANGKKTDPETLTTVPVDKTVHIRKSLLFLQFSRHSAFLAPELRSMELLCPELRLFRISVPTYLFPCFLEVYFKLNSLAGT